MTNPLKRLNSDQILVIAIAVSLMAHLILFAAIFFQPDRQQQSSLGKGQVILLEHVANQPTKISEHTQDTQAASQKSDQAQTMGMNGKQTQPIENIRQQTIQINSPHLETRKAQSTSNQGAIADQSGKDATAQAHYRQLVTQHLLKKIKNAPNQGQAIVHLNILKMGIATKVDIQLISGPKHYQQWLNRQVLNANPLPSFPNNIKKASLQLAIKISHQTEQ